MPVGGVWDAEVGEEFTTEGWRWKGRRMFKNAERAWTGTLCWAWSRK